MRQTSPILIAAAGVLIGCVNDALIKSLSGELNVAAITFWRFAFAAAYATAIYIALKRPLPTIEAIRFHTVRGAIQALAALTFFYALSQLGLAEATVLGFTAALMIAPMAWPILGERLSVWSVLAAFVGFGGAALAVSSAGAADASDGDRALGVAAVMVSAFCYAGSVVLLRLRTRSEDHITLVMYSNVMPTIILAALLCGAALFGAPTDVFGALAFWPVLPFVGLFGMGIWWMFTLAYARAPAQRLAPLEYTSLIWAAALGAVFFGEIPGWRLYAGAAVIIAACLIVAYQSRFEARREAGIPTSDILD